MKQILLFIFVAIFGVMTATAQEVDSLQSENLSARVDSLSMELKQLRHDYDFLLCQYKLVCLDIDLNSISSKAVSGSNGLMVWIQHSKFDVDLYLSSKHHYDSLVESFNTVKSRIEVEQEFIDSKSILSNFSVVEKMQLSAKEIELYSGITMVEAALEHLKIVIETYKNLR